MLIKHFQHVHNNINAADAYQNIKIKIHYTYHNGSGKWLSTEQLGFDSYE
jgi:hypothetical protein